MRKYLLAIMAVAAVMFGMTSCNDNNEDEPKNPDPKEETKSVDILIEVQNGLYEATDFTIRIAEPGGELKPVTLNWIDCASATDSWFKDVKNAKVATYSVANCKVGDKIAVKSEFVKKAGYTVSSELSVGYAVNFRPSPIGSEFSYHWYDDTVLPDKFDEFLQIVNTTKEYTVK